MSLEQLQLARWGRALWSEYVRLNGYAFEPNAKGIKRLCAALDLAGNERWVRVRINAYLEA